MAIARRLESDSGGNWRLVRYNLNRTQQLADSSVDMIREFCSWFSITIRQSNLHFCFPIRVLVCFSFFFSFHYLSNSTMAEAKKSSFFISRNPLDFLNKSRVELPKVNVSKHETGREVMVVDVKPARNCSKIDTLLNSPRKRLVTTKGISLENKSPAPSPCKRSNLKKDFCSPRTTRLAARKILGESNTATSTPLFSAATGHYEFKSKSLIS